MMGTNIFSFTIHHNPPCKGWFLLKTHYIVTLLDSDLFGAQVCGQIGFSGVTISYVHVQHCSKLSKTSDDGPSKLILTNIKYVRHIICMRKSKMAMARSLSILSSILVVFPTPSQPIHSSIIKCLLSNFTVPFTNVIQALSLILSHTFDSKKLILVSSDHITIS